MNSLQDAEDRFRTIKGFKLLCFFKIPLFLVEIYNLFETTHSHQNNMHLTGIYQQYSGTNVFINLGCKFRSILYLNNFLSTDVSHKTSCDFEELRFRSTLNAFENSKLKLTFNSKFMLTQSQFSLFSLESLQEYVSLLINISFL